MSGAGASRDQRIVPADGPFADDRGCAAFGNAPRGMISQKAVEQPRGDEGLEWITALKSTQIRALVKGGHLQLGLFDERNLFEMEHPDIPGERLVACRNTVLGRLRAHKRQALLDATAGELGKVRGVVELVGCEVRRRSEFAPAASSTSTRSPSTPS